MDAWVDGRTRVEGELDKWKMGEKKGKWIKKTDDGG